eukprot:CAMPEP_0173408480 /NCGR_PEP_ID=MMETSP1356-20130122/69834_1 /TAXON_ID=77927 ORGANISM="Hemiselmis virescens, Strain PCC157" /NCGR_SAMPLE_ID=MMETSP1356 /ASSEMBLY_ACC=CAM_ASM_000847 /LENGTH=92 /DNA_ID=CAMNT_0014369801 /DNA_START=33 /DNA_END=308 /DNA_ORIENTATION=-
MLNIPPERCAAPEVPPVFAAGQAFMFDASLSGDVDVPVAPPQRCWAAWTTEFGDDSIAPPPPGALCVMCASCPPPMAIHCLTPDPAPLCTIS